MLLLLAACTPAPVVGNPDLLHTALTFDLENLEGTAEIDLLSPEESTAITLEVGDLEIQQVKVEGEEVGTEQRGGILTIPTEPGQKQTIFVRYSFSTHENFTGWGPTRGESFTWPSYCGNLFPCNSELEDGASYSMQLRGVPRQETAVYPSEIPAEAPAYTPAFVVGDYTDTVLGQTPAGTELHVWTRPGELEAMLDGTSRLVDVFGFLEKTYGPYTFGNRAGSVSVDWGQEYGGMENHPFWHVSGYALRSQEVHTHEAAHAWFGTGVRFACWEDFVLSEGTTSYISGRALEEVGGPDLFDTYVAEMDLFCGTNEDVRALPDTCNEIDIETDPLWSMVPYMKGACFYEDVADQIGIDRMDRIIAAFYKEHVGHAARMEDMLEAIRADLSPEEEGPFEQRVQDWLLSPKCPADYAARCGKHGN